MCLVRSLKMMRRSEIMTFKSNCGYLRSLLGYVQVRVPTEVLGGRRVPCCGVLLL